MNMSKLLLALTITLFSFSASANWLCVVHNAKKEVWNGTGPTRAVALGNAMEFCSRNSVDAVNCVVDQCSMQ